MKDLTFTIIGGASAYVPGLVQALVRNDSKLNIQTIRLYDIDHERLELVAKLCSHLASHGGAKFTVAGETSLTSAVKDCNIVLNSSRPGGLRCRRIDETLPLAYDIPGQETVGPGGFFFALRSVPEALKIAEELNTHAPNAVLLNYTNPSNIVTQALIDSGFEKVVGLCDQAYEDLEALAHAMGKTLEPLDFDCLGLNHACTYSSIKFGGKTIELPKTELSPPDTFDEDHKLRFRVSQQWAQSHEGYWPNSYLAYYLEPRKFVKLSRDVGPRTDVILKSIPKYYEHFREVAASDEPKLKYFRGSTGFGDLAVHALEAMSGEQSSQLVLNLKNNGATKLFDEDTVIETTASVSRGSISPSGTDSIPSDILSLLHQLEQYQRAAAAAAASPSTEALTGALAANPLVSSSELASSMIQSAKEHYGIEIKFDR